mmetsp:Transcript_15192/g.32948  ORF Transcript_15192/g.32948 Transcript_15192/m.32948 type:complete len:203 (+) Transcript_15192:180-788(+)
MPVRAGPHTHPAHAARGVKQRGDGGSVALLGAALYVGQHLVNQHFEVDGVRLGADPIQPLQYTALHRRGAVQQLLPHVSQGDRPLVEGVNSLPGTSLETIRAIRAIRASSSRQGAEEHSSAHTQGAGPAVQGLQRTHGVLERLRIRPSSLATLFLLSQQIGQLGQRCQLRYDALRKTGGPLRFKLQRHVVVHPSNANNVPNR